MIKNYDVYGSNIEVLELEQIPETGDEVFNVGSYPIILWNSEITTDKTTVDDEDYTPKARGAIGVLGTSTVLVKAEQGDLSRGLTVKELAQFMLSVLGCRTASIVPFEPIDLYNSLIESEIVELTEEAPVQEEVKPKSKRKKTSEEKE